MKLIVQMLTGVAGLIAVSSTAFAQTAQQQVGDATAKAQSALGSTGLPLWAWIAIAVALVVILALVFARRRRPTQAIIKTRLG